MSCGCGKHGGPTKPKRGYVKCCKVCGGCPDKKNCGCDKKPCGCKNPCGCSSCNSCECSSPRVIEIEQQPEIVMFHTVVIPASAGSEATMPPVNGLYRNVILEYKADNSVYLYDSDGIPTKIAPR